MTKIMHTVLWVTVDHMSVPRAETIIIPLTTTWDEAGDICLILAQRGQILHYLTILWVFLRQVKLYEHFARSWKIRSKYKV